MRKSTNWTGSILEAVSSEVRAGSSREQFKDPIISILGHAATIATLSYAIRFWSKGTKRALFLRHEGFLYVLSYSPTPCDSRLIDQRCYRSLDKKHQSARGGAPVVTIGSIYYKYVRRLYHIANCCNVHTDLTRVNGKC